LSHVESAGTDLSKAHRNIVVRYITADAGNCGTEEFLLHLSNLDVKIYQNLQHLSKKSAIIQLG